MLTACVIFAWSEYFYKFRGEDIDDVDKERCLWSSCVLQKRMVRKSVSEIE